MIAQTPTEFLDALIRIDTATMDALVSARSPLLTKLLTSVTGLGSATAALCFVGVCYLADWEEAFRHSLVALAITVYAMTARRSEALPFGVVTAVATLVAVSRVYPGTHYLTDTVAGVGIGIVVFLASVYLLERVNVVDLLYGSRFPGPGRHVGDGFTAPTVALSRDTSVEASRPSRIPPLIRPIPDDSHPLGEILGLQLVRDCIGGPTRNRRLGASEFEDQFGE